MYTRENYYYKNGNLLMVCDINRKELKIRTESVDPNSSSISELIDN
jgi:hypothetical protein